MSYERKSSNVHVDGGVCHMGGTVVTSMSMEVRHMGGTVVTSMSMEVCVIW